MSHQDGKFWEASLRTIGCVLLISGWVLALAALVLLHTSGMRLVFVLAALAVEALGLALLLMAYKAALGFAREPEHAAILTGSVR